MNLRRIKNWFSEQIIPIQIWISSSQKRNWVSSQAKRLIKNSQRKVSKGLRQTISETWFEWMYPQRWRTSLGLALIIIFLPQFLLGALPISGFIFLDGDFITTVWQVLASIIGISFVIVVFLTQYSQDRIYERRAFPIYVSSTSMIFTVMMGLLTLMSMGGDLALLKSSLKNDNWVVGVSLWNFILFFLNLTLAINLYVQTYQLLSPSHFRKTLVTYHRKIVLNSVYQELFKRVKLNISIQYLQNMGIESSTIRLDRPDKIKVRTAQNITEPQIIDDINLDLLKMAINNAKKVVADFKQDQIVFWGLPGNSISKDYPEIASISQGLNQKDVTKFLSNAIKTSPRNISKLESASEDLLINRDLISVAISSGQAENVETSLDLYIETIDAFLDSLKQLGYRFTPELADKEGDWFNRWDIFDTVYRQYVGLLREALKSENLDLINEFVGFPSHVMAKAFQYQDHFAFRQFADLYSFIYFLSKQHVSNNRIADQITDRCGLLLAEFANYRIEPKLSEKSIDEKETKELIAYSEHILAVFSQLAKHQIDNLDFSHYRLTIGSMRRLLRDFINKHDEFKIGHLEIQIEYTENEELKKEGASKLQEEKTLNLLATNMQNKRRGALFGLGTWVCHLVDIGRISGDEFQRFLQPIGKEFENLGILNDSYTNAISTEDRNRFNWSSWEMDEWQDESYGEGKFGSMSFSSWLSHYYTYRALELTPENPETILDIKPTPGIKGTLDSTKTSIKQFLENKNWQIALEKLGNIELRRKVLENSIEIACLKQREIEEIEVVQTPIIENKVKDFFNEVEKAWQEHGTLRNLFMVYGRYSSCPDSTPPKEITPFGFYQRIPKGVFIEHPRIGYVMFGDSYGRGMAQGEDRLIGANFSKLPCLSARMGEFDDLIEIQIASLQTKGYNSIIIYGYELHRRFFESKNYEPKWRTNKTDITGLKNIDGFFKETPVIRAPINPNSVVILDPAEFGDLIQYKVDEEKSDFPLLFSVKEISKNQAKEYLAKYPDLSKHPETGIELSEEDAVRRLQQDIELTLWQRFNIENINTEAGIVIIFSEDKIEEEKSAKI